jgi:outer membrane protein OmpA-like peptidoglycan-associated protein
MRHIVQIALVVPAVLLLGAGCATKDFVKETSAKQRAEVDQRIDKVEGQVTEGAQRLGTVETRVTEESQRVQAVGSRVGTLETSVGEAGGMAKGAQESANSAMSRADGAMARADEVDGRLTKLWDNRNTRNLVETAEVRFGFGKSDLNDGAQTSLLGLVKEMKDNPRLTVELEGYTDSVGPVDYNVSLSQRRVDAVRRFLVQQGIDQTRIHAIGLGSLPDRNLPADQKRRVTVKVIALAD